MSTEIMKLIGCMVEWCTQNVRRDGSNFTWHQPCNQANSAVSTPLRWILKIRAMKRIVTRVESLV